MREKLILLIISFCVFSVSIAGDEQLFTEVEQAVDAIDEVHESLSSDIISHCSQPSTDRSNYVGKCPSWFSKKLKDNRDYGIQFGDPNAFCNLKLRKDYADRKDSPMALKTISQLEAYLSSQSDFNIEGRGPSFLSSCLDKTYKKRVNASRGAEVKSYLYHEEERKAVLAEYYYKMARLKKGMMAVIESITAIDNMLLQFAPNGNPSLVTKDIPFGEELHKVYSKDKFYRDNGKNCGSKFIPSSMKYCQKLISSCSPKGGLNEIRNETLHAMYILRKLEREKQEAYNDEDPFGHVMGEDVDPRSEAAEKKITAFKSMYPWLASEQFQDSQKSDKPSGIEIQKGLINHFGETRKKLLEKLGDFKGAIECLNSEKDKSKGCKKIDELVGASPDVSIDYESGSGNQQDLDARSAYDAAKCNMKVRTERNIADQAIKDFLIEAGITILSAGASAYISAIDKGLKAATIAKNSIKPAQYISKALKVGQYIENAYDIYSDGKGIYDDCQEKVTIAYDKIDLSKMNDLKRSFCPENTSSDDASLSTRVNRDMRHCIHALIGAAGNEFPFMSAGMKKAMKKKSKITEESLDKAQEVIDTSVDILNTTRDANKKREDSTSSN